MFVGVLTVELMIPGSGSLKDRRRVVKGVKDRIRARFNVSVAEVGEAGLWQRATLGVACVSNDRSYIDGVLNKVVDQIRSSSSLEVLDYTTEYV